MNWEERRRRMKEAWPGRFFLRLLSIFYGLGVILHRLAYDLRLLKRKRVAAAKVVCIGNITTGGTGKTPAVLLAAQTLRRRNHSVAVLSRGYGRAAKGGEIVVLTDEKQVPWTECGDEPWMMQRALNGQNVPILVCADRAKAGAQAAEFFGSRVLILDDGFQHHKLERDLDVVLINSTDPFGGDGLLPLGNLREPLGALRRAHIIVLTRVDLATEAQLESVRETIRSINPGAALLEAAHKADFVLDARSSERLKLSVLEGKEVCTLSGLGDPKSFEAQVENVGAKVVGRWRYKDHHTYTGKDFEAAERLAKGRALVTSFKDLARFPKGWETKLTGEVYVLAVRLEILKGRNVWTDRLLALAGEAV